MIRHHLAPPSAIRRVVEAMEIVMLAGLTIYATLSSLYSVGRWILS